EPPPPGRPGGDEREQPWRDVLASDLGGRAPGRAAGRPRRPLRGAAARGTRPKPSREPAGGGTRGRALPSIARRRRKLRQHVAAPAPTWVSAGAGYLRDVNGRVSAGLPRSRQTRRLGGELGERGLAQGGRRESGLRRPLRTVSISS